MLGASFPSLAISISFNTKYLVYTSSEFPKLHYHAHGLSPALVERVLRTDGTSSSL
jgi:hypothetical protein